LEKKSFEDQSFREDHDQIFRKEKKSILANRVMNIDERLDNASNSEKTSKNGLVNMRNLKSK
jgi:hypothetical protein